MAKMIYRKDTGEILGVHIIGLHAADLIHEASNAVATKQRVQVMVALPRWKTPRCAACLLMAPDWVQCDDLTAAFINGLL